MVTQIDNKRIRADKKTKKNDYYTNTELKGFLRERCESTKGTREELVQRVRRAYWREYRRKNYKGPKVSPSKKPTSPTGAMAGSFYVKSPREKKSKVDKKRVSGEKKKPSNNLYTRDELKTFLAERGAHYKGTKQEMADRLKCLL